MTSLLIEDTRRRLRAQRRVIAVMLGATVAGYVDGVEFFALTLNAIIWFVWLVGTTATERELRLRADQIAAHEESLSKSA